jgi:hypothetical protein
MARIYNVKITSGTSPGPYTIYYDSVSLINVATIYDTTTLVINVSYEILTSENGINVMVPNNISTIILWNQSCGTSRFFFPPTPTPTPTLTPTNTPTLTPTPTSQPIQEQGITISWSYSTLSECQGDSPDGQCFDCGSNGPIN